MTERSKKKQVNYKKFQKPTHSKLSIQPSNDTIIRSLMSAHSLLLDNMISIWIALMRWKNISKRVEKLSGSFLMRIIKRYNRRLSNYPLTWRVLSKTYASCWNYLILINHLRLRAALTPLKEVLMNTKNFAFDQLYNSDQA